MGSTIFFIVSGFGGCTGMKDCALTVFSVVLSWLGGFFCGGFLCDGFFCGGFFCGGFAVFLICFGGWAVFLICFRGWAVFFCGVVVFLLLLMALALPPLVFSAFLEVIRD
jgi:hypothetical protein